MSCCRFKASFAEADNLSANFGEITEVISGDVYDGPYTVTPGEARIVLDTGRKNMAQDLVVEPIPSNYGKITWNGETLSVS